MGVYVGAGEGAREVQKGQLTGNLTVPVEMWSRAADVSKRHSLIMPKAARQTLGLGEARSLRIEGCTFLLLVMPSLSFKD